MLFQKVHFICKPGFNIRVGDIDEVQRKAADIAKTTK